MSLTNNASFEKLQEISQNTELVILSKESEQNKITSAEKNSVITVTGRNECTSDKNMEQSISSAEK